MVTLVYLLKSECSLNVALSIIKMFSEMRLNRDKCDAIWIGVSSNFRYKSFKIKWPNEPVKVHGIFVSSNTQNSIDLKH